jgi:hypothetical protein
LLFINVSLVKGQVPPERFSISVADEDPRSVKPEDRDLLSPTEVSDRLRKAYQGRMQDVAVAIRARGEVESGAIDDLLVELSGLGFHKFIAVSGKEQSP